MRVAGVLGVGQTPLPQDTSDAVSALQMMLGQWQRRRWIVYRLDEIESPVTPWQRTWTVGPSGADIYYADRPGSIESGFLRQLTGMGGGSDSFPVDYPLRPISSRESWNRIPLKHLGSWPINFYYDPTRPNGTIYLWPVPVQPWFEIHFAVPQDVSNFTGSEDLDDVFPSEVSEALIYNLAGRLRVNYALPPDQGLLGLARQSLNTVRSINFAMQPLRMPDALRRQVRFRNPMAGHIPDFASATVPFPVLS